MQGTIYSGIISGKIGEFRAPDSSPTTYAFQSVVHPRIFRRDFLPTSTAPKDCFTSQVGAQASDIRLTCK